MTMGQFSFDVDVSNFQQVVMEGSRTTPVVIDFWAPWCGPCKTLKPILEKLAEEYKGKFILAKINSDENQALATQFGVRGIPAVKAVIDGQMVDEFSGALPEGAVREFLDRLIPSPSDELRAQAVALREAGDLDGAMAVLGQASQLDPGNELIRLDAAEILAEHGQMDEARQLLNSLSATAKIDDRAARLQAKLDFAQATDSADEGKLRARIAGQPDDMEARHELANLLIGSGRYAEGMDELLEMIGRDRAWNEEAARKTLLSVFNLLAGDPLVAQYRRKLASALN
jgi:putative thioredoxin